MPRSRRKGMTPLIRPLVRAGIRSGETPKDIVEQVEEKYGTRLRGITEDIIREERKRQSVVDLIRRTDKRRSVDLGRMVGCVGENDVIHAYVTLKFRDQTTGVDYEKGWSTTLDKKGRLSEILNKSIAEAVDFFRGKGYDVRDITSTNTTGRNLYRVEFVECRKSGT